MKKLMILLAALLISAPFLAHESAEHEAAEAKAEVAKAGAAVVKDAKALGAATGAAAATAVDQAAVKIEASAEPFELLKAGANKHWHNKIVHFTLALGVVGALFYLLSLRWPNFLVSARMLLTLGLIAGAASLPTGENQAEEFEKGRYHATLEMHALLGKVSLGLFALLLLLSFFPKTRKFAWIIAVAGALLVMVTGGLGGVLATS